MHCNRNRGGIITSCLSIDNHVCSMLCATLFVSYLHLKMIIGSGAQTKTKHDCCLSLTGHLHMPSSVAPLWWMCVWWLQVPLDFVGYVVMSTWLISPGAQCKCVCFKFPHNLEAIIWTWWWCDDESLYSFSMHWCWFELHVLMIWSR